MRIVYLTAGAGHMACDICLRDGAMARAIIAQGHDVLIVPAYTPLIAGNRSIAANAIFYGGINVYLQQKFPLFRHTPRFIDRLFDSRWLLDLASRYGSMTDARDLAELTLSMLQGQQGHQRKELDRLLDWLVTQPRPDVVILPNSLFAGLVGPLRQRLEVPVLCMLSGEDSFVEQFPEPYLSRTREILRQGCARIDGFLVSSGVYGKAVAHYLGLPMEKIHLITAGIDCRAYQTLEAQPPEIFTIGFRSQVCPTNGLHSLVEAFHLLKSNPETARCRLRVSGFLEAKDRPYFKALEDKIRAWGYQDDFETIGELDPRERPRFLAGLSALAVPVEHDEPTGLFVPEALAAGVPVVLPRKGCLPEWIEATGGGILTETNHPAQIAAALGQLLKDPVLARMLGTNGRAAIFKNHTMERAAASALAVFAKYDTARPAPRVTHTPAEA